jgi:hypothetical protein
MAMLIQKMTLLKSPGLFKSRAFMAEDMGLEEVRSAQTLKFQGGEHAVPFVPGIVPNPCMRTYLPQDLHRM